MRIHRWKLVAIVGLLHAVVAVPRASAGCWECSVQQGIEVCMGVAEGVPAYSICEFVQIQNPETLEWEPMWGLSQEVCKRPQAATL
jgi:hypothetical protein